MLLKKEIIIPVALGIIGFLLVIGITPLNFQNIGWLSKGDALFNYIGWEIYRYGPWTNPVGLNPNYGLEFSSSIVYSDSIPIFAIFFKIFSGFLGEPFQYFGLWLLLCFVLQAIFGYKIAALLSPNEWIKIFIAAIFLFTPVMLFRANVHLALTGHFVLLWAIYLNLNRYSKRLQWVVLMPLVLGIHFYLFVMVFALWLGGIMDRATISKTTKIQTLILEIILVLVAMVFSAWQYGYFAIALGESAAFGFGGDRINLLGFFNPFNWSLFNKHNFFEPPTIEGFAYLGAGIIGAVIFAIFILFQSKILKRIFKIANYHKFMLLAIMGMTLLAITHNVDIGNAHYKLPIDERLFNILGVVRSSGRLIWPFEYLIIISASWIIIHGYHKNLIPIFATLCALQILDTSKGWKNLNQFFSTLNSNHIKHSLTNEFWKEVPKQYSVVRIISPYWGNWNTVGLYAAQNKMATNSVFLARVDKYKLQESIDKANHEVISGKLDPKTIYLFQNWNSDINLPTPQFNSAKDLYAKIDGITLLAPNYKDCRECKEVDPSLEIASSIPTLKIGELVQFSRGGRGGDLLIEGWSHSEPWGVWSSGLSSAVAIPMSGNSPSMINLRYRGLLGPKHPFSDFKIWINGQYQKTVRITDPLNNSVDIPIPPQFRNDKFIVLKLEYLNPSNPRDAGLGSQDDRILTIGLESLRLIK